MTIHFFTRAGKEIGDSRQRAFQVADQLNARGVTSVVHQPPSVLFSTTPWPQKFSLFVELVRSLSSIKKGDIVYLQRTISNKYFLIIMVVYLFLFRPKMIFDFCDPIYVHSFFRTKILTRMADAVVVSSQAQVEWAKQFNDNVHFMHITVDYSLYQKFTKQYSNNSGPIIIGWIGTAHNHIPNLKILVGVFKQLLANGVPPFKFLLVGALHNREVYEMFQNIPGLDVEFIDSLDWANPESMPREIQRFDIGVIPNRSDDAWSKGKQSYKLIEYMACGVATVVSEFGEVPYVVQDGIHGYLASDEEDWVEKLQKLLTDPELRAKLGKAAQERIRKEYCFEIIIPRMIELINSLSRSKV